MSTNPPAWLETATRDVLDTAMGAEFTTDPADARLDVADALGRFGEAVESNGGGDRDYFALVLGLANVARRAAPPGAFGDGDGPTVAVMQDTVTGEIIPDPDAEADDAWSAGALAAIRIVAAVNDDNTELAGDVFAATQGDAGAFMLLVLAEYAAAMAVGRLRRDGNLPPEAAAALAAREAAQPPAPPAPEVRQGADGLEFVSLPVDERDKSPQAAQLAAPHGAAQYVIAAYVPGVDGHREHVAEAAHRQIPHLDPDEAELCGIEHVEDVEPWQIPHSARRSANRHLRALKRQTGRPAQLLRAWQHKGPCTARPGA